MVSSLDGFIAKKDNSVSWFDTADDYDKGIETGKQETEQFLKSIDCYVMGARTYEHAAELSKTYGWPYGDTPTIVVSHRNLLIDKPNIEMYSGDLNTLVNEKLKPRYRNAWVVGGASVAKDFINLKLADEIRVSIIPVILGDGVPFFNEIRQEIALHLKDVKAYKSGMVDLCYEVRK